MFCRGEQRIELGPRLDVQVAHADADRLRQLGRGLSHAGEHERPRIESRRKDALELAGGDDVGARAELFQDPQDTQIAVGFHGVADTMRHALQRVVQGVVLSPDKIGAVDVHGRAHALRDGAEQTGVEP